VPELQANEMGSVEPLGWTAKEGQMITLGQLSGILILAWIVSVILDAREAVRQQDRWWDDVVRERERQERYEVARAAAAKRWGKK
jgi:hypothetical protein